LKALLAETQASNEHGETCDQEEIREDGAGDTGFDDVNQAGMERRQRNDEFGAIAKGGCEDGTNGGSTSLSDLFRGIAEQQGHGDDAEACQKKA
jgi:hypothetical protein